MTRVLLAAPTPMLRAGLRALLATTDLEIVGEMSGLTGLQFGSRQADAAILADADLLGMLIPGEDEPLPPLVVLDDEPQTAFRLRELPLLGWALLSTDATAEEIAAATHAAAHGLVILTPAASHRLLSGRTTAEPPPEPLTAREREVLELVSQGLPNKLIARQLTISEHTVKFHISSIYTKLGASNRTDAVNRGARYGLITL